MKLILLATALSLSLGAFSQYQYVEISTFVNESAMGVFPNATDSLDVYDIPKTNQDNRDTYFTYYDGTTQSYQSPAANQKFVAMSLPGVDSSQTDTISWIGNYFVRDFAWVDSIGTDQWDFNLIDVDAYFRRSITDEWIHLNPIMDSLLANSTYLGTVFTPSDSTDYDEDGYVFCFQIKIVTYPFVDDVVNGISKIDHNNLVEVRRSFESFNFTAPNDTYTIKLYDLSGRNIFEDRFVGENYSLATTNMNNGLYIYTLETSHTAYSGKLYK